MTKKELLDELRRFGDYDDIVIEAGTATIGYFELVVVDSYKDDGLTRILLVASETPYETEGRFSNE